MNDNRIKRKKEKAGEVISDRMDKTAVVLIKREFIHSLYGKKVRIKKKIKVHDPENKCRKGDIVRVVETRPLSKEKCWRIAEILARREGVK